MPFFALGDGTGQLLVLHDGQDLAVGGQTVIAHKAGGGLVDVTQVNALPAQVAQGLPSLPGPLLLGLHLRVERLLVHGHALVLAHLDGQVDGEAIGVIELEGIGAGEHGLPLGLVLFQQLSRRS